MYFIFILKGILISCICFVAQSMEWLGYGVHDRKIGFRFPVEESIASTSTLSPTQSYKDWVPRRLFPTS